MRTKICIIEDDKTIAAMYQFKLERRDYEVRIAYDGHAGLALIKDFAPAIVLLDLRMPVMNGDDMLERLTGRRDKSLPPRLNERPQPHLTPRCNIALARVGIRWIIGKGIARKQYHRSHIVWSHPKRLKCNKSPKRKAKGNETRRLACHKCCGRVRNAIVFSVRPYRRRMG